MQTVNEASRNAKTLKLHSEVGFEHEGAEVRTTSRNSAPFKVAEVKKTSASCAGEPKPRFDSMKELRNIAMISSLAIVSQKSDLVDEYQASFAMREGAKSN